MRGEVLKWAEAAAGTLGAVAFVVGGVVLPQVLDEVCPALFDAVGLVCALAVTVGPALWLMTRR